MKKNILLLFALFLSVTSINAQSVIGKWKTIDDETGKAKSIVEIFEKDGKVFGKIVQLLNREPGDENPTCDKCKEGDDRKDQPVLGMEIIRDMEKDGDQYEDGTIMDPKNGKVYRCKLWVDEDDSKILNVRGYIAFLYRTQTWHRVE